MSAPRKKKVLSPVLDQILNGGPGVSLNLGEPSMQLPPERRMFVNNALNSAFVFKYPKIEEGMELDMSSVLEAKLERPIETALYLPHDPEQAAGGGLAIYLRQTAFHELMRETFGMDYGGDTSQVQRDRRILEIIDNVPSLDPFLLKNTFVEEGVEVADEYLNLPEEQENAIKLIIQQRILPILDKASGGGSPEQVLKKSQRFMAAIWNPTLPEAALFIEAFGLEPADAPRIFTAWKGISYYKYQFDQRKSGLAAVVNFLSSKQSVPVDLAQYRHYQQQQDMFKQAILTKIRTLAGRVHGIFRDYEDTYNKLLNHNDPVPFRKFLAGCNNMYWILGYCTTAVAHVIKVYQNYLQAGKALTFDDLSRILSYMDLALSRYREQKGAIA